ncbi:alpha/beta fold hydrolase [Sphingomonas sp. UYEF23]|uniref:alpha/beta fold hydrolase n=1 Tax=Sphingomonas sp. UYEF23 TaxID=1756408 RepID=UPI003394B15C
MNRPVLYLLPGLLCDATVWASQIAAFGTRYDVRVPDWGQLETFEAMAARVLDEAPDRFALGGHSMGARVALAIVRAAPDRVARLALLDTGTHGVRAGEADARTALLDLAQQRGMRALAERWLPPMVHPLHHADAALMDPLFAMVERMTPTRFKAQIAALLSRPDAVAWLSDIHCPTLIAVGAEDDWSPPSQHEAIAAAIPGASYVVFPSCGHMAPVEAPEAVNAALEAWLVPAEHGSARVRLAGAHR